MKTLESFLKEFAAFKIDGIDDEGAGEDETLGGDDIKVSIPSQDEDELELSDEDGEVEICKCCGQPIRDEEGKGKDANIEIIDPEKDGGEKEFDIDAVADDDDVDGDPMKDYDLF